MIVTGPTGSGKTTTLYSAIREIATGELNISTVEDPVEFQLPLINQFQVQEKIGLSFAAVLRSLLRQDPDVIMVGSVVEDLIEDALITAVIHGGEHTEGAIIEFVGRHITGKISQGPVEKLGVHTGLYLFFPRPPPNFGWWHRAQTPGGLATDANSPGGRASHPRPRCAPPDR